MKVQCALFGHPVAHSRSPRIYQAFSEQTGQALDFQLIDCPPEKFAVKVRGFAETAGVLGANITTPLKTDAFNLCNATSARAQLAGAANLLRFETRNWILGDNTDGAGLVHDLTRNLGIDLAGKRILVVGAGGAARGILGPLAECGPAALVVANRDPMKAEHLAARFSTNGVRAAPMNRPGDGFDLVINATSASLHDAVPAIPPSVLGPGTIAYDLAYSDDGETAFTRWALANGSATVHDGWGMLVEQAAESWDVWFGTRPASAVVRDQAFRADTIIRTTD